MDAVRDGLKALPAELQEHYRAEALGFIGQEATHRRLHSPFNGHLDRQGLVNDWAPRVERNMKQMAGTNPHHALAITAANEHFTAIFPSSCCATMAC